MVLPRDFIENIQAQRDDAAYEENMRELTFEHMIARGLEDIGNGRVILHGEMVRRIGIWQK